MTQLDKVALFFSIGLIVLTIMAYRRRAETPDGFIRGSGSVPWWMAGSTAFMTQFSAWTFTGAAQKAFENGFSVLIIFWGNALGFLLAALYFAPRFRRLRASTYSDIIALRYGTATQLLYVISQIFLTLMTASIGLYGVSLFLSAVLGLSVLTIAVLIGLIIIAITLIGGVWIVSANNFIQMMQLAVLTLVIGGFCISLLTNDSLPMPTFDKTFWVGGSDYSVAIMLVWSAAMLIKQFISINNATSSYRFLTTVDDSGARKAALLASILFVIGPVTWFLPPWLMGAAGIDLAALYPQLGEDAANVAYVHFIIHYLPSGVLGLVVSAMLAVTIAPITTAFNRDAGVVMRLVMPLLKESGDMARRLVGIGRVFGVVQGITVVLFVIGLSHLEMLSLFDIMIMFGVLLQMPLALPALMVLFDTRAPDWAGWGSVLVGISVTLASYLWLDGETLKHVAGLGDFPDKQLVDIRLALALVIQIISVVGFLLVARFVHSPARSSQRRAELAQFFANLMKPVVADAPAGESSLSGALSKANARTNSRTSRNVSMPTRLLWVAAVLSLALAVFSSSLAGAAFFLCVAIGQLVMAQLMR
uniref:Transporter ToaABC-2 n=1 Tax=Halomonas sp. Victoria JH TaxID=1798866 RepID=A0A167L6Z1_9GAMM|nr:transporter ToaABC-2 [Halomonas sp. Victoria JH]